MSVGMGLALTDGLAPEPSLLAKACARTSRQECLETYGESDARRGSRAGCLMRCRQKTLGRGARARTLRPERALACLPAHKGSAHGLSARAAAGQVTEGPRAGYLAVRDSERGPPGASAEERGRHGAQVTEGPHAGRLALIDFGLVAEVPPADRAAMLSGTIHLANGAWDDLITDFVALGAARACRS